MNTKLFKLMRTYNIMEKQNTRKTMTVSLKVFQKLIEVSSQESFKQKKRVSINDILERDYCANSSDQ